LAFEFASGVLSMRCDDDTDEIVVEVERSRSDAQPVAEAWAQDLLGEWIEYVWELRNHRGYRDASSSGSLILKAGKKSDSSRWQDRLSRSVAFRPCPRPDRS